MRNIKRFLFNIVMVLMIILSSVNITYADGEFPQYELQQLNNMKFLNQFIEGTKSEEFLKIESQLKELEDNLNKDLDTMTKNVNENIKHAFTTNLAEDEFFVIDAKFLDSKEYTEDEIISQIDLLGKLSNKALDYYILNDKGMKIYPAFVTDTINNFQTAIENRSMILNNKYDKYNHDDFYSKNSVFFNEGFKKTRRLSKYNTDILFFITMDVFNSITVKRHFTKDVEIFIVPYQLRDCYGFAYLSNTGYNTKYEAAYISGSLFNSSDITRSFIHHVTSIILHEFGHLIDGRSLASEKVDVFGNYKNIQKEKNARDYENIETLKRELLQEKHHIDVEVAKKHIDWMMNPQENFAEDIKVFFMNEVLEDCEDEELVKETVFLYNNNIESLFNDLLK